MSSENLQAARQELLSEYYHLAEIIQKYDEYYLRIKAWGVTASGAAAGFGLAEGSASTFLIASLLALAFWLTEARFKMFQLSHMLRVSELEDAIQNEKYRTPRPRIFSAFGEASRKHIETKRWRSVFFWPQVMLPHAFFVALGLIAGIGLLITEAASAVAKAG